MYSEKKKNPLQNQHMPFSCLLTLLLTQAVKKSVPAECQTMCGTEAVSTVIWKVNWKVRVLCWVRGPSSTQDPSWASWHSVPLALSPIAGMCLLALVAGHSIPNQGGIAQNKAAPPGVGKWKPTSCLMSCNHNPRPRIVSDSASCPGPHPPRRQSIDLGECLLCPLLACCMTLARLLQPFRHSVSIYKMGMGYWFLSHRVIVKIKWN